MIPSFAALDPLPAPPPDGLFDEAESPSAAGRVSEAFRRRRSSRRSLHPVGAMAASGPLAREWLEGHEISRTPFAAGTPLDRFVGSGGRILLVGTHPGPVIPYLQEKAGFPHLYRPQEREIRIRSRGGELRSVPTRTFRSPSCQVVILQGERQETRDYVLMRDYALVFPPERAVSIKKGGFLRQNLGRLLGRLERMRQRGVVAVGRVGSAHAALMDAPAFCEQIGMDLEWEVARFKDEYDPERLEGLGLS